MGIIIIMRINRQDLFKLIGLGLLLGGAGLIPGFSSGTLAFVTSLFTTLIATFSNVFKHPTSKESWGHLVILISAMGLGAWLISMPLNYLLNNFEAPLMWLFIGFVFASIIPIQHEIKRVSHSLKTLNLARFLTVLTVILLASAILSFELTEDTMLLDPGRGVFFLSAFFAALAGLLPGVSGSVVWIGFGQYGRYLNAIQDFVLVDLALFAFATVLGYILFARLIEAMMQKQPMIAYAILLGLTLSSVLWIGKVNWNWSIIEWTLNVIIPLVIGYLFLYVLYDKILPLNKEI